MKDVQLTMNFEPIEEGKKPTALISGFLSKICGCDVLELEQNSSETRKPLNSSKFNKRVSLYLHIMC